MAFKKSGGFGGPRKPYEGARPPRFANKSFARGNDRSYTGVRNNEDRPLQLFSATCAECRKTCEVPFRPNGEKPVFCRDCFGDKRGNDREADFQKRDMGGRAAPSYTPKAAPDTRIDDLLARVEGMNRKLDTILSLVEPKKPARPKK